MLVVVESFDLLDFHSNFDFVEKVLNALLMKVEALKKKMMKTMTSLSFKTYLIT